MKFKNFFYILSFLSLSLPGFSYEVMKDAGKIVKWWIQKGERIPYSVNVDSCILDSNCLINDTNVFLQIVQNSFQTWENVNGSYIAFSFQGLTSTTEIGTPCPDNSICPDNINLLVWKKNWSYENNVIGLTTNWYYPETGKMIEADIEFNLRDYMWTIVVSPSNCPDSRTVDLQNIITHEIGHFIGLDHSSVQDSTMYYASPPCEISKRDLSDDDMDGVIFLYPENPPPEISSVSPSVFYNDMERGRMSIYGKNFLPDANLYLSPDGKVFGSYQAIEVQYIDGEHLTGFFNFTYISPGKYTLIVEQGDVKVRGYLKDGVEVRERRDEGGCGVYENGGENSVLIYFLLALLLLIIQRESSKNKN